MVVLSHFQVAPLLTARSSGESRVDMSPDLGLTQCTVQITDAGAQFPDGSLLCWEDAARVCKADRKCFALIGDDIDEVQAFSPTTRWLRSLCPTTGAPTMLVSGIPMHRIKNTDPYRDTLAKVASIEPVSGRVLDTATGLGYTAIVAARQAAHVVTVELDPTAIEIARRSPWSQELFTNPVIDRRIGDVSQLISGFRNKDFARIIHDPPTISLAGDLYSAQFYHELRRVLCRGGKLFHYVGDPASRLGQRVTQGVMRRLAEAGFERVLRHPEAFGVVALG